MPSSSIDIIEQLNKLIEISLALSSNDKTQILLEKILLGAISIAGSDGGTLYLIEDKEIKIEIIYSASLKIYFNANNSGEFHFPRVPLFTEDGQPNLRNVVSYSYHKDQTINIEDAYDDANFDFSGTKIFDEKNKYHSKSFLAIPLKNHQHETIGVLQLINALDPKTQDIIAFDAISQRVIEALASQASVALTKQQLIDDLAMMFESLVKLIATAIDQKSPYTGGHCRRLPELTMMLAEAAHETNEGYLKDFKLTDEDRYELKIAGWLHDCGKITTPEFIIDKSTKLETIFDRIELLETRFEVLKRDAEIAALKHQINALKNRDYAEFELLSYGLEANITFLNEEFEFIRKCNTGGEFMDEADIRRIISLQQTIRWAKNGVEYPLLSDEEVKNLCVSRGTLTNEERAIINNHINVTISMLESIKFPKHLANVPEYAGGHHERIDGRGYPKGLKREEMSIQARAMAIADIFEALTASDRPYKKGKTLTESLSIMEKFKENNHIDPDLYDVFIKQKVYLKYANQFLKPDQIDID